MGLNVALAVAAPTIASKIDKISLPEKVLGYFEISDVGIYYYDGYLGFGMTPTFIAPPLPPPTPTSIEASTVCVENRAGFVLKWKFNDQVWPALDHLQRRARSLHYLHLQRNHPSLPLRRRVAWFTGE